MAKTIDINEAAQIVMDAEITALNSTKALLDKFITDLADIEATLPATLSISASGIINEVRNNLSYVRSTSLPQAIYRYEPDTVPAMAPMPAMNPAMYQPTAPTGGTDAG